MKIEAFTGAALMHMGSMALIGANAPENMVHVVVNNGAHESVGGRPTVPAKENKRTFMGFFQMCD